MPTWPATLPQKPLEAGYTPEPQDANLRSSMDTGPDKVRRRYTAVPEFLPCSFRLTQAQRDTFMTFWRETIQRGAVAYDWTHPEFDTAISCRIKGVPKRSVRGVYTLISLTIEVLP